MKDGIATLQIEAVYPNPNQPRKEFDPEKLEELAMSIKQYGILEPIVVTPRGDRYMVIAGERRYRASLLAGLTEVTARVMDADDALVEELALLENIQRQDLNIIEEARAYQALLNRGWTREDLARKIGFKQPWRIDERTSLLNLSTEYQRMVVDGTVGHSQAFEISRVSPSKQPMVLKRILSGELNTYNKLRAFVDGLIVLQNQTAFFSLTEVTDEERESIDKLESLLGSVERFIKAVENRSQEHFKKAVFHSSVSPERVDLIIQHLMKLRKIILTGAGIKSAAEEAA
jgi:ParB family transcriptional regulator, chromosome partitioning protein